MTMERKLTTKKRAQRRRCEKPPVSCLSIPRILYYLQKDDKYEVQRLLSEYNCRAVRKRTEGLIKFNRIGSSHHTNNIPTNRVVDLFFEAVPNVPAAKFDNVKRPLDVWMVTCYDVNTFLAGVPKDHSFRDQGADLYIRWFSG